VNHAIGNIVRVQYFIDKENYSHLLITLMSTCDFLQCPGDYITYYTTSYSTSFYQYFLSRLGFLKCRLVITYRIV